MPVQEVGKVQFEYQTPCTRSKVSYNSNSTFLVSAILFDTFNAYNVLLCMYNYNTVSGEASHSNRSIGHAMQVFNDLHYSNRCRFIGLA
jgi:hypothetical protein